MPPILERLGHLDPEAPAALLVLVLENQRAEATSTAAIAFASRR
jgi:hypothetical protein